MLDFLKIEDIEIEYEYKNYGETFYYSEVSGTKSRTLSPDQGSLRITIQDNDKSNDDTIYQLILSKREGKILIKGDFFSDSEKWYGAATSLNKDYAEITSEDETEKMVIKCYLG